jgi:hypothetical protein
VDFYLNKKEKKSFKNIFMALFLVFLARNNSSSIEIVELFDLALRKSLKALENDLDKLDKILIGEFLANLNQNFVGVMNLNHEAIFDFLIQCMKKKCKIEISSKLLTFSVMQKMMENENGRDKIVEHVLVSLNELNGGRSNLRSRFLLLCYEKGWFSLPMEEVFMLLIDQTEDQYQCFEDMMINLSFKMRECTTSLLFVLNFIKFFIESKNEKGFSVFLRLYKEIVNFYVNAALKEDSSLCKKYFDLDRISDVYKYHTRKAFLFCLEILTKKAHLKRTHVARSLLKMNLGKIISFQRKKILKIAKGLIKSEHESIFEVGIVIISKLKEALLIEVLDSLTDIRKKKIVFSHFNSSKSEIVYHLYLELLLSENTSDIEFVIKDKQTLSKVFYTFQTKEVSKYLDLEDLKVKDIYSAELALWYSKYHPDKIDNIQLSSFFFNSAEDFKVSKNINFYVKLIGILNNVHTFLSVSLKRKIITAFKDLLFYAPYTKEIGGFLSKVGCNNFAIASKTDYLLVVLAACDHQNFKNAFLESQWSSLKERALVYILSHQPEYGLNYKWKLIEILQGNDTLTRLDLLRFLNETFLSSFPEKFGDDLANFYFSFVDENQEIFFELIRRGCKINLESRENDSKIDLMDKSVSLQTSHLIYTALRNKCLLPEKAIPIFLACSPTIPGDIFQFENVILNNLNLILKMRNPNDDFLFDLFKKTKAKTIFIKNLILEPATSQTIHRLFSQILKFNRKKFEKVISEKVREFQMTAEDEKLIEFQNQK